MALAFSPSVLLHQSLRPRFTVRASGGQRCNIGFDYRIVARQRGYEEQRLERILRESLENSEP